MLGTNAAFMFRRLESAVRASGNPTLPQYLAATATIQFPGKHMETLTGHPFLPLEADDNGAPRHPTQLLHIPPPNDDESLESVAAKMITSIIDNDPDAQLIVFHDSRQGAERIAAHTHRRSQVTPYRAGYLPQERRDIEDKLRANTIRAIVSTSALEVGIDMPDLNYAINIGLPPTRKQLHQRLGRVGRTRPATFIILADHRIFQRHNESLTHYYRNSVEPSRLHMDNTYIAYQHALCYQQENRGPAKNAAADLDWPPSFTDALAMVHDANPPETWPTSAPAPTRHPPQIAYSLRSTGEESLDIIPSIDGTDASPIGSINPPNAISELFPGALYRHNGRTYQAREWRRRQGKPYVRVVPKDAAPSTSTRPMLRKVAIANPRSASHSAQSPGPHSGGYAHVTMTLWTSAEGFVTRTGGSNIVTDYSDMPPDDPLSRKTVSMPTSGFLLYINAPWMDSDEEHKPAGRSEIANLLAHELSYQHSVALPNLGSITSNILTTTPQGDPYLLENALAVYDNIHGGLGLNLPLARDIARIIPNVTSAPSSNPQLFLLLKRWLDTATEPFEFPRPRPHRLVAHLSRRRSPPVHGPHGSHTPPGTQGHGERYVPEMRPAGAEADPCCSSCAADVMAKAFIPSTAAGGRSCPVRTVNFHRVRRRRPPSPPCSLPCSAREPSSLLLAQGFHACNCPHLSYGHPLSHWLHRRAANGTTRSMERDDVVYSTRRRAITPTYVLERPARSCSAWTVPSASPCPRRWSIGACPSALSTWPSSNWPTRPGPSVPLPNGSGPWNSERSWMQPDG